MEFGRLDQNSRKERMDFIMDTDVPTYYKLYNEILACIQDINVSYVSDDMDRYYMAREVFDSVLVYINGRYDRQVIQEDIMVEEMKQIREYYRMIPEPPKKQFDYQLSREQELQLFGSRGVESGKQKVKQ